MLTGLAAAALASAAEGNAAPRESMWRFRGFGSSVVELEVGHAVEMRLDRLMGRYSGAAGLYFEPIARGGPAFGVLVDDRFHSFGAGRSVAIAVPLGAAEADAGNPSAASSAVRGRLMPGKYRVILIGVGTLDLTIPTSDPASRTITTNRPWRAVIKRYELEPASSPNARTGTANLDFPARVASSSLLVSRAAPAPALGPQRSATCLSNQSNDACLAASGMTRQDQQTIEQVEYERLPTGQFVPLRIQQTIVTSVGYDHGVPEGRYFNGSVLSTGTLTRASGLGLAIA